VKKSVEAINKEMDAVMAAYLESKRKEATE